MEVTFLLGNGYDKSLGLPTTYKEFYKWYLKQESETEGVQKLKDSIQNWIDNGDGNWSDFEMALGQFTTVLNDRNEFIACFKSARASLMQYLNEVYEQRKTADSDFLLSAAYRLSEMAQSFFKDFKEEDKTQFERFGAESEVMNFISFNYTPLLKENNTEMQTFARNLWTRTYEGTDCVLGRIINVHGLIDEDPILGVNDITQIANEAFRNDSEIVELMVKGEVDKKAKHNWRTTACDIIKNSDAVYIYGMSLGDTDLFWWEHIAEWFESDSQHKLAIHCHVNPDGKTDVAKKEMEQRTKISNHLRSRDIESSIIVDSTARKMTVMFAHMAANVNISTQISATLTVKKQVK